MRKSSVDISEWQNLRRWLNPILIWFNQILALNEFNQVFSIISKSHMGLFMKKKTVFGVC